MQTVFSAQTYVGFSELATFVAALSLAFAFGSACAPLRGESSASRVIAGSCGLPEDQRATLMSRWPVLPIPLALASGWRSEEAAAIAGAVRTWNDFYGAALGVQVFDAGSDESFRQSGAPRPVPTTLCQESIVQGNRFVGSVVIHRLESWNDAPSAIAVTRTCYNAAKPLPRNFMAMMDVNYQNFFALGRKIPDLQSILLHELGHLLGLDHSCNISSGRPGFPYCKAGDLPESYYLASMFPQIFFDPVSGLGEERRELNDNDEIRGGCVYQGFSSR